MARQNLEGEEISPTGPSIQAGKMPLEADVESGYSLETGESDEKARPPACPPAIAAQLCPCAGSEAPGRNSRRLGDVQENHRGAYRKGARVQRRLSGSRLPRYPCNPGDPDEDSHGGLRP